MTTQEWKSYCNLIHQIINHYGGVPKMSKHLGMWSQNVYNLISPTNFKKGKLRRKFPLAKAHQVVREMPEVRLSELRPDLFEEKT